MTPDAIVMPLSVDRRERADAGSTHFVGQDRRVLEGLSP
jgi:hypothetical protein